MFEKCLKKQKVRSGGQIIFWVMINKLFKDGNILLFFYRPNSSVSRSFFQWKGGESQVSKVM